MPQKVILDKTRLIKQISLFSELEPYQIEFISKKAEFFEYKKDEFVYKEGDPQDAFYLMISGRAKIFTASPTGEITILEYLHRGSYVGILSLLTNEPHSVSVQILNDSVVLKIIKEDFYSILKSLPQLAVHFSTVLAKRLKRKEAGQKIIFESSIISIYGIEKAIGRTLYALNLAQALRRETKKDVIFLEMVHPEEKGISEFLEIKEPLNPLELMAVFFDEIKVKNSIIKHKSGTSILRLSYEAKAGLKKSQIASLLSYLTNIFAYCIIDLPHVVDEAVVAVLEQSDLIHLITDNKPENITSTNNFIDELEKFFREPHKKIKIIGNEFRGALTQRHLLKYRIYATLADRNINEREYNLAIRRIARDIGNILVGLALGGGAALGLAHIGVIKVLEKEGIPIDVVAGSSMGALVGAFWAAGKSGTEMEAIALEAKRGLAIFTFKDLQFPLKGLISDARTMYFLRKYLGNKTFYDIRFPLKIVAASLEDAKEIVIDSGSLADAVRATISIPGIYSPVKYENRFLIDGGVVDPIPISVLLKMNVRKIIAVNILPSPEDVLKGSIIKKEQILKEQEEFKRKGFFERSFFKIKNRLLKFITPNIMDVITNSIEWLEYSLGETSCRHADVTIHPNIAGCTWQDFLNPEKLISLGMEACTRALPEIKRLMEEE